MFKLLLKLSVLAVLIYLGHKGLGIYAAFKLADHANACELQAQFCALAGRGSSKAEATALFAKSYACIAERQGWVERWVMPIPKTWTEPDPESITPAQVQSLCDA